MSEPLFVDLHDNSKPTEIESLCMKCEQSGTTRLLFTKIPHFKEIIIMAFECPHCGFRNNELQSAGAFNEKAHVVSCKIEGKKDLDRQLVKSDFASVKFKELDMEIPANRNRGLLTTVEGLVSNAIEDLAKEQPVRQHTNEDLYKKIQAVIDTLSKYQAGSDPFTLIIDDPSGNSYIEDRCMPAHDPQLSVKWYVRTPEQNAFLGLATAQEPDEADEEEEEEDTTGRGVLSFPSNCSHCNCPCETNMHVMDIPHFKEIVLMATNCEHCGYKSSEVKSGGAISPKGKRITLKLTDVEDLSRDILKSDTCGLSIPEIRLELQSGTLGGRFTTVEGLLQQVHDELGERAFSHGDSATEESKERWKIFLSNLNSVIKGERLGVTLIIDDPLANSYLQNLYAPDDDPEMTTEEYERDWEINESLGLNDMKTEGYAADTSATDPPQ